MKKTNIPSYDSFMNPVLQALKSLGGSGTIEEINNKVSEITELSDEQLEMLHEPDKGSQTEVEYRIAWARTYLKKYGMLENSNRGIWSLTQKGRKTDKVEPQEVKRFVQKQKQKKESTVVKDDLDDVEEPNSWREVLLETILKMEPAAFERLIQRLLRESGFIQVEVTGQSGDGGIDGKGIMRLAGLLSFHVIFQCKRYRDSVTASQVRDFRGAMVGRADKGLLITTGNFTKDAMREATRDGAPAIDLIDGSQLIDKLKELRLGIQVKTIEVEKVIVENDWFSTI
jgi:restriction system protein